MLWNDPHLPATSDSGVLRAGWTSPEAQAEPTGASVWSSGLCDLQINGFAGVDYNQPTMTPEAFERSMEAMLRSGVTRCLPTVITGDEAWQSGCFRALEAGRQASALGREMAVGYHLEGPFLNPEEGFRGCHPHQDMAPARWDHFQRLQEAAGGNIRLITVAPEMEGVMELIPRWVEQGVVVALGHCNPSRDQVRQAVEAGATLSTHLGNGTASPLPKSDNVILRQLAEDGLSASFIADGIHVQPHVLGVYLRAKQSPRTILVTDGTAGAATLPGRYTLGPVPLERQEQDIVYIPGTQSLAGSAATLSSCVRNVTRWFKTPLSEAVQWASEHPRQLLGMSATPEVGALAEGVRWVREDSGWQVAEVLLGNRRVSVLES